jgi:glycine oxidase
MRLVIAGGGVIGCAVAYYAQKAGAQVVLLERGEIGGEASGASAGMLIEPLEDTGREDFGALRRASLDLYPALLEEVQEASGVGVEYVRCGLLRTARSEASAATLRSLVERKRDCVSGLEWVAPDTLRQLEPALSPRILGAAYSPRDANLNPGLLTQALALAAERLGADVRRGEAVTGFLGRGARLRGVNTHNGGVAGDAIVLAAGAWTGALAMRLGVRLRTRPRRGQMLAYRSTAVRHAVWGEDGYLVPKPRGFLWAGATVEDTGFRARTTARGLAGMRRMASGLVPALRRAEPVSAWAGLRPGSPDGLPVIGRLPGRENVYIAGGHFRNGILLAPVTGKLLSELVLEGRPDPLLAPFGPERFA